MDIESECFPCIPMSSAIQLSTASLLASQPSTMVTKNSPITSTANASSSGNGTHLLNAQFAALNGNTGVNRKTSRRNVKNASSDKHVALSGLLSSVSSRPNKNSSPAHLTNLRQNAAAAAAAVAVASNVRLTSAHLPPTPPASNSDSDCETNGSAIASQLDSALGVCLDACSEPTMKSKKLRTCNSMLLDKSMSESTHFVNGNGCKINNNSNRNSTMSSMSSLISVQPKNAVSGTAVVLTDEEKRTLIAEGYPIPTRFPLSKAEERSLKKIRRKIKNKISAQESRRKKKEYMEELERKVAQLDSRVKILESENHQLRDQLRANGLAAETSLQGSLLSSQILFEDEDENNNTLCNGDSGRSRKRVKIERNSDDCTGSDEPNLLLVKVEPVDPDDETNAGASISGETTVDFGFPDELREEEEDDDEEEDEDEEDDDDEEFA